MFKVLMVSFFYFIFGQKASTHEQHWILFLIGKKSAKIMNKEEILNIRRHQLSWSY